MAPPISTPMSLIFTRAFWMMVGPALLVLISIQISTSKGWLTMADIAFFATTAGIFLARWHESRRPDPRRADGEPMQAGDLRRFALQLLPSAFVLWVIVNLLGNYRS